MSALAFFGLLGALAGQAPSSAAPSIERPGSISDFTALEHHVQELRKRVLPAVVNLGGGTGVIVGERLILRMKHAPSRDVLARLNREFSDVVTRGRIERIPITAAERRDEDALSLERLALFPTFNFGRLRQLIDALNRPG